MNTPLSRQAELQRLARQAVKRRYRARRAGLLPPIPRCVECGGRAQTERNMCHRCWVRVTEEGKRWNRERMRVANLEKRRRAEEGQ